LIKNGNVPESRISLHPIGESEPVASNASEKGREQNRRVEIVARNAQ
jgi:flagellar motor protein MotB